MSSVLKVQNLSVRIADNIICESLSLSLETGMCVGILGSNGAGKTTLLHSLAGLRAVEQGTLNYGGKPSLSGKLKAQYLAVLLQKQQFMFPSTVLETAMVSRYAHTKGLGAYSQTDQERVVAQLAQWDLSDKHSQMVSTLSGGEAQRLALAMVCIQDPKVYLLDEPVNNLDIRYHRLVVDKFGKNSGTTSMVVLHDLYLAAKMCSHLLLLKNGAWHFGTTEALYTQEKMQWLYGVEMQAVLADGVSFYMAK